MDQDLITKMCFSRHLGELAPFIAPFLWFRISGNPPRTRSFSLAPAWKKIWIALAWAPSCRVPFFEETPKFLQLEIYRRIPKRLEKVGCFWFASKFCENPPNVTITGRKQLANWGEITPYLRFFSTYNWIPRTKSGPPYFTTALPLTWRLRSLKFCKIGIEAVEPGAEHISSWWFVLIQPQLNNIA